MRNLTGITVLILASAAFLSAQTDPPGRVGRLNYMDGPVSFRPAGVDEWVDASVNRPLIPGDDIWVGDRGRSELHVGSTALRLDSDTAFQFLNLDDQVVQIRLSEGTLTVRMRNFAQNQVFEVDTPNVAFTMVRPGDYRIDANPDSQTTTITVRDGEGEVTGGGDTFPVYARQQVAVRGYDQIDYRLASAPGLDSWDQWCSARDRREDQSQSARYVSREMNGYEDLDEYGRWNNEPGYGNVWMPTSVDAGWAPYHDGHWAWIEPWGWTWVDDAPWGFAPYHYGRWASFGGRWGWIPGPYGVTPVYAPALVAWVGGGGGGGSGFSLSFSFGTAAAVGWFPLGPREPYFPSYQASQGYFRRVNNTNTVFNNTTINNYYNDSRRSDNRAIANIKYANRDVRNGVTAVPRDTFDRGRQVTRDARAVPSAELARVQIFAAPAIAPRRESVLGGRADTASQAPRPPANVLSRPVVARRAPPPAPVPFDRRQPALDKNPGRPLPPTQVQQLRQGAPAPSAPVRVVDMGRVNRVQPKVGTDFKGAPQPNAVPQPAVTGQQQQPPGRQQQKQQQDAQQQQLKQQQDVQQQQLKQQQDVQRQQQQKQQQDAQQQQQQKRQQDAQQQQQQKQQQDARQQQQLKQQQDGERQQQLKQQQDARQQQQQKQQQDAQRQQQQKQQQDAQQQQQLKQQQDAQRQQQLKQQQDAQQQQQQKQQQDARQQQQQKQQQDAQQQQQLKQQQDAQQQQQLKQQQDARQQQQQKQQQDARQQQQQKQQQDAQQQQQLKQQQDAQQQQQLKQQQDARQQQRNQQQDARQQQQRQQPVVAQPAPQQAAPAPDAKPQPPPVDRRQRQDKGKQQKPSNEDSKGKSDK